MIGGPPSLSGCGFAGKWNTCLEYDSESPWVLFGISGSDQTSKRSGSVQSEDNDPRNPRSILSRWEGRGPAAGSPRSTLSGIMGLRSTDRHTRKKTDVGRVNNGSSSRCKLRLTRCLQAAVLVLATGTLAGGTAASAAGTRVRADTGARPLVSKNVATVETVACGDAIATTRSGRQYGYRVVAGVVSVPPAFLTQVNKTGSQPWPFWRKAAMLVRADAPVLVVRLPMAWRNRAAITWGAAGVGSILRFARCPSPTNRWNVYAGGFYLRSTSACVPLDFEIGARTVSVLFGVGRRCRSSA